MKKWWVAAWLLSGVFLGTALQAAKAPPPPPIQYKVVKGLTFGGMERVLNEMAAEGWEFEGSVGNAMIMRRNN